MKPLLFLLALTGSALASDLDFLLVNGTGRSFEAVYISAADNKDWDGNLLANGKTLQAGGKLTVKFPGDPKKEVWDINVVDDEGLVVRFEGVKLSGADQITLTEKNGKVTASVE
jgi:hypothetical protein